MWAPHGTESAESLVEYSQLNARPRPTLFVPVDFPNWVAQSLKAVATDCIVKGDEECASANIWD